ncbi:hypothetical protein Tco_1565231, partial [Tanacetum coccineum]
MKRVNTFVDMDTELVKESSKKADVEIAQESSSKRAGDELEQEKEMDQDSAHMVAASKVPMLKPSEYELWRMRMEQYIQMIDYSLWEVMENGNAPPITKVVEGV